MACGEPSPTLMKQMEVTVCQICGRDMQSLGHQEHAINYQKQVDPPSTPYSQIIPDSRYDEIEEYIKRNKGKSCPPKAPPLQVCFPIPVVPGKYVPPNTTKKNETATSDQPQKTEEPKSKDQNQPTEKTGSSTALKASCLPAGGGGGSGCPPPVKMMLCLPCPPPSGGGSAGPGASTPCPKPKPTDYTYRCESRELRGGNLYQCCQCNKRNGLQHDCPRSPCQGRPACLTKPWPDCWPSGGCHGIDYTREKGVKRIDPCRGQRFDKKECRPPGGGPKADCGGNMMVVVCPPSNCNH